MFIFPYAEILGTDAPFWNYGICFRKHDRSAANSPAAKMDEMPVVSEAVGARVLAHRRN
jgi:capsid portal protein